LFSDSGGAERWCDNYINQKYMLELKMFSLNREAFMIAGIIISLLGIYYLYRELTNTKKVFYQVSQTLARETVKPEPTVEPTVEPKLKETKED
jgi:hypothetical protein